MANSRSLQLFLLMLLVACGTQEEHLMTPKAHQVLNDRLAQKKGDLIQECIDEIIREAEVVIDSLVREDVYLKKIGAFDIPEIPAKPVRPTIPVDQDTGAIKPLIPSKSNPDQ